jgi:1,4-alpha-glucan branching enzyme
MANKKSNKTPKNRKLVLSLILLFFAFSVIGQDSVEWIGSYSSKELEGGEKKDSKTYFYWQIENLKRAVPPRYIKLVDIENYRTNGKFINKGILFTYFGLKNSEISLCANFTTWRCIPMKKNRFGVFYIVANPEIKNRKEEIIKQVEYKFKVDNLFETDPLNSEKVSDGSGSYYSEYIVEDFEVSKQTYAEIIKEEMLDDLDFMIVEFKIYQPKASVISLVGDFNGWNPEHDYLKKESNGIFILRKKLRPGEYLYNYIVDGEKILDVYNPETRHRVQTDELSSYIKLTDYKVNKL